MDFLNVTPQQVRNLIPSTLRGTEAKFYHSGFSLWKVYLPPLRTEKERTLYRLELSGQLAMLKESALLPQSFLYENSTFMGTATPFLPNITSLYSKLEDASLSYEQRSKLALKACSHLAKFHSLEVCYPDFHLENLVMADPNKGTELILFLYFFFLILEKEINPITKGDSNYLKMVDIDSAIPFSHLTKKERETQQRTENWLAFIQLLGFMMKIDLETVTVKKGKAFLVEILSTFLLKQEITSLEKFSMYQMPSSTDISSFLGLFSEEKVKKLSPLFPNYPR